MAGNPVTEAHQRAKLRLAKYRAPNESARDVARQIAVSWQGRVSRRLRKKVEMLFAHLNRKLDRMMA